MADHVKQLSDEFWAFLLDHKPGFAIFKGILPAKPRLDDYNLSWYKRRAVSTLIIAFLYM